MCLGRLKVMAFNPTWRVLCEMWSVKVILEPNIFLFYDLLVSYCFPRHPTTCLQGPQKINLFSAITKNTSFTKQPNRRPYHWATHPQHWLQQMFKRVAIRVAGPDVPKIQALPEWGKRVWSLPGFFWRMCPHTLRALKGDHLSPKSDISPQKCSLFTKIDHWATSI